MERALDPELLSLALGQHDTLPSVGEISELIAQAELALLVGNPQIDETLTNTAWYLHAVASSKYALKTYGLVRQRAAFRVSAHIFDLITKNQALDQLAKLKFCFASQVAYLRSELNPNAIAVYSQEASNNLPAQLNILSNQSEVALSCGISFLGFDVGYIYRVTKRLRDEINRLLSEWDIDDIYSTPYGSVVGVALAVRDLMTVLVYGRTELLDRARESLQRAIFSEASSDDQISRWVAAHILNLFGDISSSSIWSVLPPNTPVNVKQAFSMGRPRVLTLWPPQIDLVAPSSPDDPSPLSPTVKRLFLSTPTSSGKTLLAQLLIASHLSSEQTSIYYVAPTRSLCREVRVALESRLRFLGREIVDDLPEGDWLEALVTSEPHVEVMTPERLSYLLRSDSHRVLSEVGMFVFDEVHNLGDQNRGWTLEQDLTFLHFATATTGHRLILMSAAVGNRNHFVKWMEVGNNKVVHRFSEWRGPRRIHAIYRTEPDWNNPLESPIRSTKYIKRVTYPMFGRLDVRISQTGDDFHFSTSEPVGELVFKFTQDKTREKDDAKSTPFYQMLIPIIEHLSQSGPVLIIETTRPATVRMAKAISETQNMLDPSKIKLLSDLVKSRLGNQHPLWGVLQKGVAYHHSSLPHEIRVAIEDAVTFGNIRFLVATTTMTEGINLPVKSVVIANQGAHYGPNNYVEYITGSKLINAIGRAGRATKETEGIVVLARQAQPKVEDFNRLRPDDTALHVTSRLATKQALDELAAFEETQRAIEDAIIQISKGAVSDFISFIWFISAQLEITSGLAADLSQIETVLQHSLAWLQLLSEQKEQWLKLADLVIRRYTLTEPATRRRWAVAGTSVSSASKIEQIARSLANDVKGIDISDDPTEVAKLILANGRIEQILSLPEVQKIDVYASRGGSNRPIIPISLEKLLIEWMLGIELVAMADENLALIPDIDYRFEQLGDFIYQRFEVSLPWAFGTIITWTNQFLTDSGETKILPRVLPAYVRWGVGNTAALELMSKGLGSRTLAMRIANSWHLEKIQLSVIDWLKILSAKDWQRLFSASSAEVGLLLNFCRNQQGGAAVELMRNGITTITVDTDFPDFPVSPATIESLEDGELTTLGVWVQGQPVGRIQSKDQADISTIQSSGLDTAISFSASAGRGKLQIGLIPDL
jgi:hypothetical protein